MNAAASPVPAPSFPTRFALGAALVAVASAALALALKEAQARTAIAAGGLVACALLALHPGVLRWLRARSPRSLGWIAAGVALWTVVLPAERFDPYMLAIVLTAVLACVHACVPLGGRLTAVAVVVWLCLWLPLDLRWYGWQSRSSPGFFLASEQGYACWALATACLGVLAFGAAGRFDLGIQRASLKAPLLGLAIGLGFGAIAIPVGMATGFLSLKDADPPAASAPATPGAESPAAEDPATPGAEPSAFSARTLRAAGLQLLTFCLIALTIAFPEELFFRGVLDRGLELRWKRPWLALLVSSFLFGLMHWNNRKDLADQITYLGLASLAGIAYGLAFRKGGLLSAIFLHALVDWVWQLAFSK
ncbi:MAG: CPBP family intramembrane metalloprotease [Planctomycetes bacterium]|nr:CPBP family intramembrane metalloprotease [Planctomycetota bacterium]